MHESHQLGHLGHFHALGHHGADSAAHQQPHQHIADARGGNLGTQLVDQANSGQHGNAHADHAEQVTAP